MKKIKLILFVLILAFVFPNNILALEKKVCKVYDSGSEEILTKEVSVFEENLRQKTQELNAKNSQEHLISYSYKLHIVSNITNIEKQQLDTIEVLQLFNSREEAVDYFETIELEKPYTKGDYTIDSIKKSSIIYGDVKEKKCLSLDCKDEINELNRMLNHNQKLNYEIKINEVLTGEKNNVDYKENGKIKYFDNINDANLFASNYPQKLDGYKFINNEVVSEEVLESKVKTYLELKGKDTFDTEQEAQSLLNEFKLEYPNAIGKIERINNGSSIEKGTLEFTSKIEALNKMAEITKDTVLEKVETELRESVKKTDKESIYGEYNTKEEAEAVVNELKDAGYIVESNIKEVKNGITGNVESGKKFEKGPYEFPIKDTNFVLIKQGSGHYAVWTEYELTNDEKNTFVNTYNSLNSDTKFDGSTIGIAIDDITWISGYGAHNLSYIGKNWGTYTFTKSEDNIIFTCDADKVSHIIQGFSTPKVKYVLTGSKYKEEKVWYVDYIKTMYSFLYKINASALIEESVTKYKVVSNFEKIGKEALLSYSIDTIIDTLQYKLNYEKYISVKKEISLIKWEINECSYFYGGVGNFEEIPPQTGSASNLFDSYFFIILLMSSLITVFNKLLKIK